MIRSFLPLAIATSLSVSAGMAQSARPAMPKELSNETTKETSGQASEDVSPGLSAEAVVLERLGEQVRSVWDNFSLVTCTEVLQQEKLNEKSKVVIRSQSKYDYFILLSWDRGKLVMDESRVEVDPPRKKRPEGSLLATQGFATLLLVFHPEFQTSYTFALGIPEPDSGLTPLTFLPRNQGPTPGALELSGRVYPIAWRGTAWVNQQSGVISRIHAEWHQPPTQVGLRNLTADVHYAPIQLEQKAMWLPDSAQIELSTEHQQWRNTHEFANYQLFSVETEVSIGGVEIPGEEPVETDEPEER